MAIRLRLENGQTSGMSVRGGNAVYDLGYTKHVADVAQGGGAQPLTWKSIAQWLKRLLRDDPEFFTTGQCLLVVGSGYAEEWILLAILILEQGLDLKIKCVEFVEHAHSVAQATAKRFGVSHIVTFQCADITTYPSDTFRDCTCLITSAASAGLFAFKCLHICLVNNMKYMFSSKDNFVLIKALFKNLDTHNLKIPAKYTKFCNGEIESGGYRADDRSLVQRDIYYILASEILPPQNPEWASELKIFQDGILKWLDEFYERHLNYTSRKSVPVSAFVSSSLILFCRLGTRRQMSTKKFCRLRQRTFPLVSTGAVFQWYRP